MPSRKDLDDIEGRIVPVEEAEPHAKLLIYGRHGSGKTRFAASAPGVLLVDINERGTRSARQFKEAKVFPVRRWSDIPLLYWYLRRGDHDYQTVALDTITAMNAICMKHVLGEEAERDPNKDPAMPSRREWGKAKQLMEEQLLNFRNLPMHVIFTAQERVMGDADEGEAVERVPDLPQGARGVACASVGIIGRLYRKEVRKGSRKKGKEVSVWEPRMLIGPHDEYPDLKDRSGVLSRVVRNPTMELVLEAWLRDEED